ncbi:GIY-YIG nuclease family protein [Kitasatospora sp. MBT63]|uniref:GIY-YIG nuclease family protein n=1 Tax=Kitasatospora sp. MBT63 TaxID=1444768 RepID=UPI00068F2CEE|nr:GIY-YIG nuclease family protein [Kitasatospora sp. MBT63]
MATRKKFFDSADLAARGWHEHAVREFLGHPVKNWPRRGHLYLAVHVEMIEQGTNALQRAATWHQRDEEYRTRREAREARAAALNARRTALYRLFDAAGVLLYVGIASHLPRRFEKHAKDKPWWTDVARKEIEWFDGRSAAESAEEFAIVAERPLHNKKMAREEDRVRYLHRWLEQCLLDGHEHPFDVETDDEFDKLWEAWCALTDEIDDHVLRGRERLGDGLCRRCQEAHPCAVVREVAARFSEHPQYAPLWEPSSA